MILETFDGKKQDDEDIMRTFSTHWIKYLMPSLVMGIVVGAGLIILATAGLNAEESPLLSLALLYAGLLLVYLGHHWFFHNILGEAMEDIIITNKRVIWIKESLFRVDDMRQIPLDKIQGVEARKHGVLQTCLGYGTLWFDTGGTVTLDENAIMDQVPHPNRVARDINQLLGRN